MLLWFFEKGSKLTKNQNPMKNLLWLLLIMAMGTQAQMIPVETQINEATMALDEKDRNGAGVYGYDAEGKLITLRESSNKLICLSDNPKLGGFNVACYHEDLEPFMARGRALKAEGKNTGEIEKIREFEANNGTLMMPKNASTLYVLSGEDKESANLRWVVYIPFATAESTGLPTKPLVAGGPWIMFPGTYRAHIMITPPKQD